LETKPDVQMISGAKSQRIRDPLHNLIEFGTDQFEQTIWGVIQTAPFQRLRRIRQLGFSEFVFLGATHTRFAHSIGVYDVARSLIRIIEREAGGRTHQADVALAAALVHDVGMACSVMHSKMLARSWACQWQFMKTSAIP
jgi:HD superfamily phosphohydrolase